MNIEFSSCHKYLLLVGSLLLLFGLCSGAMASDDDYLKALEAEADNVQLDSANNKSAKPGINANTAAEPERVSSNQRIEFEKALRIRLPKSYDSYLTLNKQNQNDVIYAYFSGSKQMHLAIRKLYRTLFKKK